MTHTASICGCFSCAVCNESDLLGQLHYPQSSLQRAAAWRQVLLRQERSTVHTDTGDMYIGLSHRLRPLDPTRFRRRQAFRRAVRVAGSSVGQSWRCAVSQKKIPDDNKPSLDTRLGNMPSVILDRYCCSFFQFLPHTSYENLWQIHKKNVVCVQSHF